VRLSIIDLLSSCVVLQNGTLYLGCCHLNFEDPITKKVNFLRERNYKFKLKEVSCFGEETYFCDELNLSYKTDYYGDSHLHYLG